MARRPLVFRTGRIVRRRRPTPVGDTLLRTLDEHPERWRSLSTPSRVQVLSRLGDPEHPGPLSRLAARALLETLSALEAEALTARIGAGQLAPRRAKLAAFLGYRPALHLGRPDPMLYALTRWEEDEEPPDVAVIAEDYGAEAATRIAVARGGDDPLLPHVARWLDVPKDPVALAALTEAFGGDAAFDAGLQLWVTEALARRSPGDEDWWRRARDVVVPWALGAD